MTSYQLIKVIISVMVCEILQILITIQVNCPALWQHTHPADRQRGTVDDQDVLWNRGIQEHQEVDAHRRSDRRDLCCCGKLL